MASFAPIRGTQADINSTPLVDGQFLIETDQGDQNKIYIDSYDNSTSPATLRRTMAGGGGHEILPSIDPLNTEYPPTEEKVVDDVNTAYNNVNNDKILSLYGAGHWTNVKNFRRIMTGTTPIGTASIGSRGIGTWDDTARLIPANPDGTENPQSLGWYELDSTNHIYVLTSDTSVQTTATGYKSYWTTVPTETDWWYDAAFVAEDDSDDIEVSLKFDPTGDTVALGGYMLDSNTGRICIKFANSITPSTAKIAVDVVHTRNEYS